mgnify:CR=1 FL=1
MPLKKIAKQLLFISRMPKSCTILQLVSAPSNPPSNQIHHQIQETKESFARYEIPDIHVTDFARIWLFDDATSLPYPPQSNSRAENAVKSIKNFFKKCQDSSQSDVLAIFYLRNTLTGEVGTSSAQDLSFSLSLLSNYSQSNGKAKIVVKTIKILFKKIKES